MEPAASEDSYGGVVAANNAVARAVGDVAAFVAEAASKNVAVGAFGAGMSLPTDPTGAGLRPPPPIVNLAWCRVGARRRLRRTASRAGCVARHAVTLRSNPNPI